MQTQTQATLPRIFISYRREDSAAWAGRIADLLTNRFGSSNVFFDVHTIKPGSNFVRNLHDRASQSDVMLAIIGEDWLTVRGDDGQPRLKYPGDFVRTEIAIALSHNKRVIPVLVSGARMPHSQELPEDLAGLADREAVEISETSFHSTMDNLFPLIANEVQSQTDSAVGPSAKLAGDPSSPDLRKTFALLMEELRTLMLKHWMVTSWCLMMAVLALSPIWYGWIRPRHHHTGHPNAEIVRKVQTPKPEVEHSADAERKTDFRTLYVITHSDLFAANELRYELERNPEFGSMRLEMVDDPDSADAVLELTYRGAGDFSYELKSRTKEVLLTGKDGSFTVYGAAGTAELAQDLIESLAALEARQVADDTSEGTPGKTKHARN